MNFYQFCRHHGVTFQEAEELMRYLAMLRHDATIQALRPNLKRCVKK